MVILFIFNNTTHVVYSPLNSYVYIHCIFDFKYILLYQNASIYEPCIRTKDLMGYNEAEKECIL